MRTLPEKHGDGRRVLAFLKPYGKWVFADSFVIALSQVCATLIPTLAMSWLVDHIIPDHANRLLWGLMWLIVFAAICDLLFMVIDEYFCHHVAKSVTNWQKLRLFGHLQILPYSFFHTNQSGEMLARVADDPETLHSFLAWEGSTFMAAAQGVVIYSIVLLWIHPYLMVTSVVLGVFFYWMSNRVGAQMRTASAKARQEASRYLERLRESVTGIHLSRVMGMVDYEVDSVMAIRQSYVQHSIEELKAKMKSMVVIGSYNGVVLGAVYVISVGLIWNNHITTGKMLTAGSLVTVAASEINRLLRNWLSVRRTGPALDRSEMLLAETPSDAELSTGRKLTSLEGEIEFKHVQFAYPMKEENVLQDISFSVSKGEVIAIVGPSGAGKSTIADLILRFYEVKEGAIKIDGHDIRTLHTGWLRKQIAVVSQDVQLRNGTLADNLLIGNKEASDEELLQAIKDSGLAEFVQALPKGIHTSVGERGTLLSGGQKQRLSLARALLKNAPILILDEASSALDPITETQVNEAIQKRARNQTIILITHRLSTVLSASKIIVLEKGKVMETGSHKELIEQEQSIYVRLFKREVEMGEKVLSN